MAGVMLIGSKILDEGVAKSRRFLVKTIGPTSATRYHEERSSRQTAPVRNSAMPSPSQGTNPYFERAAHWRDFHNEFLTTFRRTLVPQIVASCIVQLEDRVYIHDIPPEPRVRIGRTDVSVARSHIEDDREQATGGFVPLQSAGGLGS
jgi:hypothetical protein